MSSKRVIVELPFRGEPMPIDHGDSADPNCQLCLGVGWVCEGHPDKAWGGMTGPMDGSCECGPGMPCQCNPMSRRALGSQP
jgi:hypothetical protein